MSTEQKPENGGDPGPPQERTSRRRKALDGRAGTARERPPVQRHATQPSLPLTDARPLAPAAVRRVLLTGASGFLGREVMCRLLAAGSEVVAVSRAPRRSEVAPGVIQVAADVTGTEWHRWCAHCTAAIHLAAIIREAPRRRDTFDRINRAGTESVVAACVAHGIRRLVHVSALGARRDAATAFLRSKGLAEESVRHSGLTWTIIRPALIFGPGDRFSCTLARMLRRLPVFPVFGGGAYVLQPVAVSEVAAVLVAALEIGACAGEVIEMGGPEVLTYVEAVRRTAAALAIRRSLIHLPLGLSRLAVRALQWLPNPPITPDQLTMLLAGSRCDTRAASLLFDPPKQRYEGPIWLQKQAIGDRR
jgi:uncharacterized protein YbjT (DUF2867 family)